MQREIIINEQQYKVKKFKEELQKSLLRAEDDIENGRVRDAREVFQEWKEKYGI